MIVTCLNCNSNFKLDDTLVKPTGSTVRCSTCKNVFVIYSDVSKDLVTDEVADMEIPDVETEVSDSDFDISDIQVDFDDIPTPADDDIDLSDVELDLDSDFDLSESNEDEIDLSDIQIDFDDEPSDADDDFGLQDIDTDFDLPDMDEKVSLETKEPELTDDDLLDFDLDDIAVDLDAASEDEEDDDLDLDFDLSLDDDLPDFQSDDDKTDKENFLDATDYDPDEKSDGWDVDGYGSVKKEKTKKRGCLFILFIMILVASLASGGIYFAVKKQYIDIDKIELPPFINEIFKLDTKGQSKLTISPYNSSNLRYVINKNEDKICVIEGKLTNNYKDLRKFIKVVGKLLDKDNVVLAESAVFCGNVIADLDLANYTIDEINKKLGNKNGDNDEYATGVKSGAIIPFMIVFSDLPENMKSFSIEPVSSNIE